MISSFGQGFCERHRFGTRRPWQGGVGLAVTAAVETVALGLPTRCGDRADAAHHGEARLGAEPIRVIPNVTAPAFSVPTPSSSSRLGASSSTKGTMNRSSSAISSLRSRILRARDFRESLVATTGSIADRVRPPGCTGTQALHAGEVADLVTHFLRCGIDGVVELLQGRAALDCRLSSAAGLPRCRNGLWPPGPGVLRAPPRPRRSHPGRRLALGSSAGWVRPGHLEHGDTRGARCRVMPARRYRWIHSYTKQLAMRAEPAKHRPVAGSGGGERFGTKHRSVVAHDGGGVQVLVGVRHR